MPTTRHVSITVTKTPTVLMPAVSGTDMVFNCTSITALGRAEITRLETATPAGWTFGWMQAEWCETNWAHYRGERDAHGSSFLQRGRAPARTSRACRDSIVAGAAIYNTVSAGHSVNLTATTALPLAATAQHFDKPAELFPLQRVNSMTTQPNFLREAQLEFMFCAVLVLNSPAGVVHQLAHFYWNVRWQARFLPSSFTNLAAPWSIHAIAGGQGAAASRVFSGTSNDRRFNHVMVAGGAPNCNVVAGNASTNPNIREARTWQNFNVTQ